MADKETKAEQEETTTAQKSKAPEGQKSAEKNRESDGPAKPSPSEPDQAAGEGTGEEEHDRFKDATENLKETTEKLWENTRHAFSTATSRAGQYKRVVQKKIDLAAIHKKISAAHADLGKQIDDLREQGKKNIMNQAEVKQLCQQLDSLKATAAALEEEIENIRDGEHPAAGPASSDREE